MSIKKGNLIRNEWRRIKYIDSIPELIKRTGIVVNCHDSYCSVVFLDDGRLAAIKNSELEFLDDGGEFFLKQLEMTRKESKDRHGEITGSLYINRVLTEEENGLIADLFKRLKIYND